MAGKGKNLISYDWQTVYNLFKEGSFTYFELSQYHFDFYDGFSAGKDAFTLPGPTSFNPEKQITKKELSENLSKEAKDVISLILNSPAEILKEITTPAYNKISKELIKKKLKKDGWENKQVEETFNEIKTFVKEIDE